MAAVTTVAAMTTMATMRSVARKLEHIILAEQRRTLKGRFNIDSIEDRRIGGRVRMNRRPKACKQQGWNDELLVAHNGFAPIALSGCHSKKPPQRPFCEHMSQAGANLRFQSEIDDTACRRYADGTWHIGKLKRRTGRP